MMNENLILIDWFCFTTRVDSVSSVIQLLGLDWIKWTKDISGHYGYRDAYFFGGIWIMYNGGKDNMGICVEMSGIGCRQFETSSSVSFNYLFDVIKSSPEDYRLTRLDVAYDDVDRQGSGLLDIAKICGLAYKGRYVSKFSSSYPQAKCEVDELGNVARAHTCYFGSSQSEVRFRIYDKAAERGGLGYHWVRFELQLRRDAALNFIRRREPWGERFTGVINNYLRFIVPNRNDSNRRRSPSPKWWTDFIGEASRISLYTQKDIEYNLSRVERYIFQQAGNSIETYIQCVGLEYFQVMLSKRDTYLNVNQKALIAEYKQNKKDVEASASES